MVDDVDDSRGENSASNPDEHVVSERVQELTWALLDEQINDDEFLLLGNLLLSDDKARDSYIGSVQLHANLMSHFAVPTAKTGENSPVLSFFHADLPLGMPSTSGKEAIQ